jgi:ankyrin repeat protein
VLIISQMFQGRDIPWEHQISMLSDFERVANLRQGGEQSTAAAFHVALCYILGFGTKVEYSTATQYLRKAEEQAHPLAQLFGPRLLSRISNLPNPGLLDYTDIIHKGFCLKRFFSKNSKISLTTVTEKSKDQELKGLELDTDATQPHNFSNFQEFRNWLKAFIRWKVDLTRWQVTIGTGPKMNFVECAIAFEDTELLSQLLHIRGPDWDRVGAWGETPLVQATRRGNARMVSLLLNAFHDPCRCDESGASVYHWLFSLTVGNDEPTVESLFASLLLHTGAAEALQHACTTPYVLHPQWPLQLLGTPLAFAVMSGSLKTVEALLRHGVDPRDPVYAAGEDDMPSKWTALHVATKYHFSQILTALVQKAGEIIRSSDDPFEELGMSMVNSKNPFRKQQWGRGDFPEALLAEVLLEFPELQLPCVLGHVTIVERYGIHGMDYRQSICDVLDILPLKALAWRSSDGQTALMQAIDYNDYDLASVLLDRSPNLASTAFRDPAEKGAHTWPFHFACQIASRRDSEESTDIANRILQLHPRAILDKDSRLRTALHMSVTGLSSKVTRFLLFNAAPADAEDIDGASALHYARSLANVVALLDRGANIDYTNEKGLAPIHLAASIGADDIVAELVKRGAKLDLSNNDLGTPLHCAVIKKSKASVYSLVQGNAPINAQDRDNNTPLILAAQSGRNDIVQILLDGGADVSLQNNSRVTPLRAAILGKSSALVEKLLNHDVSHIAKERSSQTLLHLAAEQADAATMKVLLDKIPSEVLSIDALNGTLQTPLHVAALAARADVAQIILEYNPILDVFDADGATSLLLACRSGKKRVTDANGNRTEFVDLLVEKGACLTTCDNKGQSPWTAARKYQDFNLMAYLLERLHQIECIPHLKEPPDRELIEWAIQQEEWDFITTCLGTGALNSDSLPAPLVNEHVRTILRLYAYARRGDKTMVQWVFESSRKGSLMNNSIHTGIKYTGMRNMYLEFHESPTISDLDVPVAANPGAGPAADLDAAAAARELRKFLKQKEGSHRVSNFFSGLRRKKSSTSRPSFELEDPEPSSSDLHLSPTSTRGSSSLSPDHLRTPSIGSSFDTLLNRVASGRNGTK